LLSVKGTPYLTLQNNGQVAVAGNAAPFLTPEFSVRGNGRLALVNSSIEWTFGPNVFDFYVYAGGFLRAKIESLTGDWVAVSDRSLKENIQTYKPVLEDLKKIQVSTYHYKQDLTDKNSFGLIAQNVAEYFPEIVSPFDANDGKKLLGVSYAKTGVLAIKAIQEQQEIIELQQKKIDDLEKRILALEKN
jgi:hypothetical protein